MSVRINLQVSAAAPELLADLEQYADGRARAARIKSLALLGLRVERGLIAPSTSMAALPATPPAPMAGAAGSTRKRQPPPPITREAAVSSGESIEAEDVRQGSEEKGRAMDLLLNLG